jgi:hypothetical protein
MIGISSPKDSKIGYVLIAIICAMLFYTIVSTRIFFVEVSDIGLINLLPVSFWVGLVCLAFLWYFGKTRKHFAVAALLLTCCYLFIIPALVRIPTWISQSYYPFGEVRLINLAGHLEFRSDAIFKSYLYWPGFLYIGSAIKLVTGISDTILLKFFPPLIMAFYGFVTFLILRRKLGTIYSLFAATWFLAAFFLRQQYFGPPSIGYVFFLLVFLILSQIFFEKNKASRETLIVLLLLFTVTTFTHVLTSLIIIGMVVAIYVANRMSHESYREVGSLVIFLSVIFISYNLLVTPEFFDWAVLVFSDVFAGERQLGLYKEPERIIGSMADQVNYYSSLALIVINLAIALIAIIYELKKGSKPKGEFRRRFFIFCVILLIELAVFALGAEYGPHESYQRAFMFALVPLAYLCVTFLSKKPKLLIVFIVLLSLLNIPAQYGSDSYTLATDSELAGAKFFVMHTPDNIIVVHKQTMYMRYYAPEKQIKFLIISDLPPTSIPNATVVYSVVNEADYVVLSNQQNNYYLYFLGVNPLRQVDYDEMDRIYDNGDFIVDKHGSKQIEVPS